MAKLFFLAVFCSVAALAGAQPLPGDEVRKHPAGKVVPVAPEDKMKPSVPTGSSNKNHNREVPSTDFDKMKPTQVNNKATNPNPRGDVYLTDDMFDKNKPAVRSPK